MGICDEFPVSVAVQAELDTPFFLSSAFLFRVCDWLVLWQGLWSRRFGDGIFVYEWVLRRESAVS